MCTQPSREQGRPTVSGPSSSQPKKRVIIIGGPKTSSWLFKLKQALAEFPPYWELLQTEELMSPEHTWRSLLTGLEKTLAPMSALSCAKDRARTGGEFQDNATVLRLLLMSH